MNEGILFEQRCVEKLNKLGFDNVQSTPITDYGADIIAFSNGIKYIFQCKYCKQKQGVSAVQEILTAKHFYQADKCVVISHSGYTKRAYNLAKPNFILLITEPELFKAISIESLFTNSIEYLGSVRPIIHDYDIITEFNIAKDSLGRTPSLPELDKSLRYKIRKQYKKYSVFLNSIGERLKNSRPTEEQLKKEYIRIRTILGRTPRAIDIKKNSSMPYNSFHQYPLSKLQKECGDIPLCDRSATTEDLILEYKRLETYLGRQPKSADIDKYGKYGSHLYFRKWGSLINFYQDSRINANNLVKKKMTYRELIVIYSMIEYLLNDSQKPYVDSGTLKRVQIDEKPIITPGNIDYRFGNIQKFVSFIGSDSETLKFREKIINLIDEYLKGDQSIISEIKQL